MNNKSEVIYAVSAVRVSSTKQGLQGDSPDDQRKQIEKFAEARNIKIIKFFEFIESASGEKQPLQEAIDYCKKSDKKIKYLIVKSIDRFTRAGSYYYDHLKMQLTRHGIILTDVYGMVGGQEINTMEHLDLQYGWSVFSPTRKTEILNAEDAKDEIRTILTRMISAEVRYVRKGFRVRPAPFGYQNEKIETPYDGVRVILKPHPIESPWVIRMFDLRAQGNLSDEEIVSGINLMGYKSRKKRKHDPNNRSRIIGFFGETSLTVAQLQDYIQNPIYCGINCERWTNGKPVKQQFEGLVTTSLWNRANKGKKTIIVNGEEIRVIKGKESPWQGKKEKENPLYPYKKYVLCPSCKNNFYASASKGKKDHFPAYHCRRMINGQKHNYRVKLDAFNKTIEEFVKDIRFTQEFLQKFREVMLGEWEKRERMLSNDTITINEQLIQIEQEIQLAKEKIKILSSIETIRMFEDDIEKMRDKKALLIMQRDNKEDQQITIDTLMNYVSYFFEHLEDLLLGSANPIQNAAFFGLLFEELPTYENLVFRTPKLACIFELNDEYNKTKNLSVSHTGLEPDRPYNSLF